LKFKVVDLKSFGCFEALPIEFAEDKSFHVIYGPNEAGKSTLLRAITDLLYGIPHNTLDTYLYGTKAIKIEGSLLHSDSARNLQFSRRKGNKNTVLDVQNNPLEESALQDYLGDIKRDIFINMFGLNHQCLKEGGLSLVKNGGAVGESLFEAATGIADLQQILLDLDREARELFKTTGTNPKINAAIIRYKEKANQITQSSLAVNKWREFENQYHEENRSLQALREELKELGSRKRKIERISRSHPLLTRRARLLAAWQELGEVVLLADTAAEERIGLAGILDGAAKEISRAETSIAALEAKQSKLVIPENLIEQAAGIAELHQKVDTYREYSRQLQVARAELAQLTQTAQSSLREINPTAASLAEAEKYRLPLEQKLSISEQANRYPLLAERLINARKEVCKINEALQKKTAAQAQLGEPRSAAELYRAVDHAKKSGGLEAMLKQAGDQVRELEQEIALQLQGLPLWQGTWAELEKLTLPLPATVDRFEGDLAELEKQQKSIADKIAAEDRNIQEANRKLNEFKISGDVPTEGELVAARGHRQTGWALIRQWLEGRRNSAAEQAYAAEQPLVEVYEKSVAAADHTVDRMRREAEQVGSKAIVMANLKTSEANLQQLLLDKAANLRAREQLANHWREEWQSANLVPKTPKEMRAWQERRREIIGQAATLKKVQADIANLAQQIQEHRLRISIALAKLGEPVAAAAETLEELILRCDAICKAIDETASAIKNYDTDIKEFKDNLIAAQNATKASQLNFDRWKEVWLASMQKLHLPANTSPAIIEKYLANLDTLFESIGAMAGKRLEINNMVTYVQDFSTATGELVKKLAPQLASLAVDLAVSQLQEMATKAGQDLASLQEINTQIAQELAAIQEAGQTTDATNRQLQALMQNAHCDSLAALVAAEQASQKAKGIQVEIESIDKAIEANNWGMSLAELAEEIRAVKEDQAIDLDALDGEVKEIDHQLNRLDAARSELEQRFGVTRDRYEKNVGGNSTAALEAAEEAQEIIAELNDAVNQYLRLRLANTILRKGIEQYRQENQETIIKRAGEIINLITAGSLANIKVGYDKSDNPVLLGVRSTGEEVEIDGMSDGTQDQLYLSLRLASIEKYLDGNEPIPFIVDDILVNFDEKRSRETLKALASFSDKTQVIFFTHHNHLVELAQEIVPPAYLEIHDLEQLADRHGEFGPASMDSQNRRTIAEV